MSINFDGYYVQGLINISRNKIFRYISKSWEMSDVSLNFIIFLGFHLASFQQVIVISRSLLNFDFPDNSMLIYLSSLIHFVHSFLKFRYKIHLTLIVPNNIFTA